MGFENDIKQWVMVDSTIRQLSEQAKEHRATRTILGTQIYQHITNNNLEHAIIQINDGTLKFQQTKITQPLTLKFIKGCLDEYLGNSPTINVDEIMNYIKEKRDIRYADDIKRYYT